MRSDLRFSSPRTQRESIRLKIAFLSAQTCLIISRVVSLGWNSSDIFPYKSPPPPPSAFDAECQLKLLTPICIDFKRNISVTVSPIRHCSSRNSHFLVSEVIETFHVTSRPGRSHVRFVERVSRMAARQRERHRGFLFCLYPSLFSLHSKRHTDAPMHLRVREKDSVYQSALR